MRSGQFSRAGLEEPCPSGFTKVCEGSAAVLFPPAMVRGGGGAGETQTTTAPTGKPSGSDAGDGDDQAVFYNPAQVVNRDLSICAIQVFANLRRTEPRRRGGTGEAGITILEALSATGLRAMRYFKEITGVRYIIANDLDADAVACIRRNCRFNDIPAVAPGVHQNFPTASPPTLDQAGIIPNLDDAVDLMHRLGMNQNVHHYPGAPDAAPPVDEESEGRPQQQPQQPSASKRLVMLHERPTPDAASAGETAEGQTVAGVLQQELMDVVDLDPYGTASPFLDAALGCIKEGGLMLVTSTDSAILCGNYPDTCHAKYNALPHKGSHCHEMAVRILLGCVERVANKHKKYIVPLLSLHIDFYVRCFFRVYRQPAEVKLGACKLGYQLQCTHCPAFWVRPMAVATTRITKAARRAASASSGGAGGGDSRNAKRGRSEVGGEATSEHPSAVSGCHPPPDRFPTLPARGENPKVHPLTLRRLFPALHRSPNAEAETVAHGESERSGRCAGRGVGSDQGGHSTCPVCGVGDVALSGPLYAAATQDQVFLSALAEMIAERAAAGRITATARVSGLVQLARDELADCPLFYNLPDIASYVRVRCPPTPRFVAALVRLGYRCSQVHCCAAGLKTDCPAEVLFAVMLRWKATTAEAEADARGEEGKKEGGDGGGRAGSPRLLVGAYTPAEAVDFAYDPALDYRAKVTGVAKFVPNAPGWGPKRRHQGALHPAEEGSEGES